ncbi:hypothetical protein KC8_07820 [Sphingomonas sp. KC8]|nr:hypothetical protein KC8_07820 [Sphingomonas sp. KC8]
MLKVKFLLRLLAPMLVIGMAGVAEAQPVQQALVATDALQPGLWRLQVEGETSRNMCVADAGALIQLRHAGTPCSRLVIANQKSVATVHYSCPGAGWGRTTVKVVTPRAVTIETQGIADNAPFQFSAAGHRIGDCAQKSASLNHRDIGR